MIAVFFLGAGKAWSVPFVTEPSIVPRSGMSLCTFRLTGCCAHFSILPPLFYSPRTCPPIFHSGSPVIFSVKFDCRLSALSSTACRRKTTAEQTSQPSSCNGCAIRYFMSGVPNRSLLYVPAVGHPPFLTGHISFFIFSSHPLYQFPPSVFLPFALHPVTGLVLSDAKVGCRT